MFRRYGTLGNGMSDSDKLLSAVLQLPEHERADMAAKLLDSLAEPSVGDIDEAWAAEIESRCAAVDSGTAVTTDWNDVRRRVERDIFGR
jgi:putative addiction module component (TIGR02574 family)